MVLLGTNQISFDFLFDLTCFHFVAVRSFPFWRFPTLYTKTQHIKLESRKRVAEKFTPSGGC